MYASTPNQEYCLRQIINTVLDRDLWPVSDDDFDMIQYRLSGYPGDNLVKKYTYASEIWKICLKRLDTLPLEAVSEFDDLLGLSGKRRHFNHSFEVFLLGLIIMRQSLSPEHFDLDKGNNHGLNNAEKRSLSFFTWLFSAATHDFGYPLEQSTKIIDYIAKMYSKINATRVADKIKMINTSKFLITEDALYKQFVPLSQTALSLPPALAQFTMCVFDLEDIIKRSFSGTIHGSIDEKDINSAYSENKSEDVHGFVSALILARLIFQFAVDTRYKDIVVPESLMAALGAVMVHSLPLTNEDSLIFKIDPKKNAYGYILAILDAVQDWDRNYTKIEDFPTYTLDEFKFIPSPIPTLELNFTVNSYTKKSVTNSLEAIREKKLLEKIAQNVIGFTLKVGYNLITSKRLEDEHKNLISDATAEPIELRL